ncbi:MAG: glycosyltransferase family 39 protein, partial [Campylobacterota bacterium]|nr:glycosyltransferase family 39 protein [Campylobacterota bacterium]
HPPLVGWTQYIFTSIFGVNEFGSRVSAILIGFVTSLFIYQLLYQVNQNAKASFVAILALNAMFMFNALFLMLMPDTLLFLLIVPIIFSVIKVERENSLQSWLILALFLGLAGLSKYTTVLFLPPIILYIIIKKRYELFYTPKILVAFALGLLLISPVLYWNIQNDWISFSYQSNHVVGSEHINWKGFGASLSAQIVAYNPLLVGVALFGLYRAFKSQNDALLLSALFGLVLFVFFTYSSLYKTALPHWSALFYLLFVPIGSYYLWECSKAWRNYLKIAITFGMTLSALIYLEVATKLIALPDIKSLQVDIYGFDKILKKANEQINNPKKEVIAVTHWTLASRTIFYNAQYESDVYLLDKRHDQFDIWENGSPLGKDLIVIDFSFAHQDTAKYMKCTSITEIESFNVVDENSEEKNIRLIKCSNYQGLQ